MTFTPDASQIEVKEKNGASHQLSENTVANLAPNLYEFYSKAKQVWYDHAERSFSLKSTEQITRTS